MKLEILEFPLQSKPFGDHAHKKEAVVGTVACYVVHRGWAKEEGASCYSRDDSPYRSAPLVCHYLSENATEMPLWILSHSSLLAAKHAGKLAF